MKKLLRSELIEIAILILIFSFVIVLGHVIVEYYVALDIEMKVACEDFGGEYIYHGVCLKDFEEYELLYINGEYKLAKLTR